MFWAGLLYWAMVWGALGCAAGKTKGRADAGLICGFLLGPLGAALMLAMDPVPRDGRDRNAPPTY